MQEDHSDLFIGETKHSIWESIPQARNQQFTYTSRIRDSLLRVVMHITYFPEKMVWKRSDRSNICQPGINSTEEVVSDTNCQPNSALSPVLSSTSTPIYALSHVTPRGIASHSQLDSGDPSDPHVYLGGGGGGGFNDLHVLHSNSR